MDSATPNMTTNCPMCSSDDEHRKAESDARTLADAGEIRSDKKRHGLAMGHLKKKAKDAQGVVAMEAKVKAGLQKAFPKSEGGYDAE